MLQDVWDFLARGGPLMVPIALCSVISLAVFLERMWALQRNHILPTHFLSVIDPYVRERKWSEARHLADQSDSAVARILRGGLRRLGETRSGLREGMEEAGRRVADRMGWSLGALSAVANVAPLLGLLGTVTGMIDVFQRVDESIQYTGDVQAGALASGIWEALLTTAAGLSVAIPSFIAFKYLEGRIDRYIHELEERSDILADHMAQAAGAGSLVAVGGPLEPAPGVERDGGGPEG
jgi:biopolymer transport protein ExbB